MVSRPVSSVREQLDEFARALRRTFDPDVFSFIHGIRKRPKSDWLRASRISFWAESLAGELGIDNQHGLGRYKLHARVLPTDELGGEQAQYYDWGVVALEFPRRVDHFGRAKYLAETALPQHFPGIEFSYGDTYHNGFLGY